MERVTTDEREATVQRLLAQVRTLERTVIGWVGQDRNSVQLELGAVRTGIGRLYDTVADLTIEIRGEARRRRLIREFEANTSRMGAS